MKITKFGHSCLLVEEQTARILIDPGIWSTLPADLKNLDVVLITHEHPDHVSADSLQTVLKNNPNAIVYTNRGVGTTLDEAKIPYTLLENGQSIVAKDVLVEAFGEMHAEIYPALSRVVNTGYRIAKKFFYGGDSVENIVPCEILAYPVLAPWMRSADAVDYAKAIKPKVCFPVHDGFLKFGGPFYGVAERFLQEAGIEWVVIEERKEIEA